MNLSDKKRYFHPAFLDTLSILLPTEEQTWLLQSCLWTGQRGEQAWARCSKAMGDPTSFLRKDKDGIKGLLPLLFDSLQNKNVFVEKEFQTYLRTAYLRDELRSRSYSQICRHVTSIFSSAGIPAVLLKGAALAETAYEKPVLQHSHYLDFLLHASDLSRAMHLLPSLGFTPSCQPRGTQWEAAFEMVHESQLPLVLHRRLFHGPFYRIAMEEIWARSRIQTIDGVPTRLLSPTDNLLHICGSVFDGARHDSLRWACDAWFLIRRYPNLDWDDLLDCACRSQMALPLFVTIGYLAEALNAPIPAGVVKRLSCAASKVESIGREVALFGVQRNARGGLMKILRNCGDWSTRAVVIKWALFPSPSYVRWFHEITWSWLLPLYYVYRPLRYLVRSLWFLCRRLVRHLWVNPTEERAESKALSS